MRPLDLVNRVLGAAGLALRVLEHERAHLEQREAAAARREIEATVMARVAAKVDCALARAEAARLRRHLGELDALLVGVEYSDASVACRRVVAVALGRDVEPAA